jgi:putative phosphoesterase
MKLIVISDSHGHIVNLKIVMGFAKKYGVSAVVHAGDWNSLESVETVLSFGIPLYTVLGNADIRPEVIEILKEKSKKFDENFLILNLDGKKIGVTHKESNNKKFFLGKKLDLIINGHFHSISELEIDGTKVIRPGAIIKGNNFAVYDTYSGKIEFVEDE